MQTSDEALGATKKLKSMKDVIDSNNRSGTGKKQIVAKSPMKYVAKPAA